MPKPALIHDASERFGRVGKSMRHLAIDTAQMLHGAHHKHKHTRSVRKKKTIPKFDATHRLMHCCAGLPTLSPMWGWRKKWDLMISGLVLYILFIIPWETSVTWWDSGDVYYYSGKVMDGIFWVDIFFNFRTGFVHSGELVMDSDEIVHHYLSSWFAVDITANVPWEYILTGLIEKRNRTALKSLKWLKLPKLLRLGRILKSLKQYVRFFAIAKLSFIILWVAHLLACVWVHLCVGEDIGGTETTTLPLDPAGDLGNTTNSSRLLASDEVIELTACEAWSAEKGPAYMYGRALYEVLVMMLGGVVPSSTDNPDFPFWFSQVAVIVGTMCTCTFMATVYGMTSKMTSLQLEFQNHVGKVNKEMAYYGIPDGVRYRVRKYYDYLWINNRLGTAEEGEVYANEDLSLTLRKEIAVFLHRDIDRVPLFSDLPEDCIAAIAMNLKTFIYLPGDIVIRQGDVGRELFIISRGSVEVVEEADREDEMIRRDKSRAGAHDVWDARVLSTLHEGDFFGEIALLAACRRVVSVRASIMCELSVLTKKCFHELCVDYPELLKRMITEADRHLHATENESEVTIDHRRDSPAGGEEATIDVGPQQRSSNPEARGHKRDSVVVGDKWNAQLHALNTAVKSERGASERDVMPPLTPKEEAVQSAGPVTTKTM